MSPWTVPVVYAVTHRYERDDGCLAGFVIGYFVSQAGALSAIEQVRHQPGFRDHMTGFEVRKYVIDVVDEAMFWETRD